MKKLLPTIILLVSVFLKGQVNLDSGLVACYPLNSGGADLKNGHNGTLHSGLPANDRFSKTKRAIQFNGGYGSYMELPNHIDLKGNAVSFSAWIKATSTSTNGNYIVFTENVNPSAPANMAAYSMNIEGNFPGSKLRIKKGDGSQFTTLVSVSTLTTNTWYHVCFTMDNSTMNLYLNGLLEGSTAAIPNFQYGNASTVFLAASGKTVGLSSFSGIMDNVKFYDRVLTAAEVAMLHAQDPNCLPATQLPVCNFSTAPACIGAPTNLFDNSNYNPDFWQWSVTGGGTVSDIYAPNPIFIAGVAQNYTIQLICANDLGSDTISKVVHLKAAPNLTVTHTPPFFICQWDTVFFSVSGNVSTCTVTLKNLSSSMGNVTLSGVSSCKWPPNHYMGTYLAKAFGVDSTGCVGKSDSLYVKVNICEHFPDAIPESELNGLVRTYPNPFDGYLTIEMQTSIDFVYEVYSLAGELVATGKTEKQVSNTVDLTKLSAGFYFLQLKGQGRVVTRKIVKSD